VAKPLNTLKREAASVADTAMSAAQMKDPFRSPPVVTDIQSARVTFPLQFQQARSYTAPRVALVSPVRIANELRLHGSRPLF
jgi:hypothetical protein